MFYKILRFVLRILFGILFHPVIKGKENVPMEGKMIMASNHLSNWDPPLIGTYLPRPLAFMAKEELFKPLWGFAGTVISALYAFPVKRGAADRGAIKAAIGILKKGLCLGVFPEGTRSRTGKTGKAQAGVGLLAAMSKAPVVPTAIIGSNHIFQNGSYLPQIKIIFGEPMYFEGNAKDKAELEAFSQKIMEKIDFMIKSDSI